MGDFLDLDSFARFLAAEVLLPSYDSILAVEQNFYVYLDPRSNKFGFIPWDLDSAWGMIWLAAREEQARASIWHPWIGKNRYIDMSLLSRNSAESTACTWKVFSRDSMCRTDCIGESMK